MKIGGDDVLVTVSKVLSYIPVVSAITALIEGIVKSRLGKLPVEQINNNHYYTYLDKEDWNELRFKAIPIIGNIAALVWNFSTKPKEEPFDRYSGLTADKEGYEEDIIVSTQSVSNPAVIQELDIDEKIRQASIGPNDWEKYLGWVEVESLEMPDELKELMKSPDPYNEGKLVCETCTAIWMPEKVNGKEFTLREMRDLIDDAQTGNKCRMHVSLSDEKILDQRIASGWVLMTNKVIPGSTDKTFKQQKELIEAQEGYEVPSIAEATVGILMKYICSGEKKTRLYPSEPLMSTRCKEFPPKRKKYHLKVGEFNDEGILKLESFEDKQTKGYIGMAAMRRF